MGNRCFRAFIIILAGDNMVERLALDLDEWPEVWPSDDPAPVLVITIGGKEADP